jgi:GT2 family glycosyltransferase
MIQTVDLEGQVAPVSVVIVNWNSGALLRQCLASLAAQSILPEAVWVVDNASSDGSADCVTEFPNCRLLLPGANLGFAAGNNLAFRDCTSEFVVLLNPDAFADPDWLAALLAAAAANPDCASFGSRQLVAERPEYLDGTGDAYHASGLVWRLRHGKPQQPEDLEPSEIFSPCAAAALYRRDALEAAGGFDEDHFCYLEDVDLGFRLRLAGHRALYVPDAVVRHVGSATSGGQHSDFALYHGHRNLVWTYVKNMPGVLFWLCLPLHILLNLVTVLVFAARGRGGVLLRAKLDALKALPRMWCKRKAIQKDRRATVCGIWRVLDKGFSRR